MLLSLSLSIALVASASAKVSLPVEKIYGVNIGNWLVYEPWMTPDRWTSMGGEFCSDCSQCRQSEWSLAKHLGPAQTNAVFQKHWREWFTQADVQAMVAANLNTIRIPLGFWIIEDIVDRATEPYAQGGLDALIQGLNWIKDAGMNVILDHHALPGVSSINQMFAGNCTRDIKFYDSEGDHNYKRAVTWGIVMTYLTHVHPVFKTVYSIEAINEVDQNPANTPGYGKYMEAFVLGVRAIEQVLGVRCEGQLGLKNAMTNSIARPAFISALPIIHKLSKKYNIRPKGLDLDAFVKLDLSVAANVEVSVSLASARTADKQCIFTQFMTSGWQSNKGSNPADVARGPQLYDHHVYLNFGGVAPQHTEESYMQTVCNFNTAADNAQKGNSPVYTGEFSLALGFNATNEFLKKYGDAQKYIWNKGQGWTFWNWKVDKNVQSYPILYQYLQWSYMDSVAEGVMTRDPSKLWDEKVCDSYRNVTIMPAQHRRSRRAGGRAHATF